MGTDSKLTVYSWGAYLIEFDFHSHSITEEMSGTACFFCYFCESL